ncbi:MAG: ribosome maturation factor RimM [Rickettsiaceae bacterium]|nr:ribosome maturation factor RimM [Rickettsiaceae bacterium]MDP4832826.1 ribosome maturation factor RimM [Rickettsiaceae bacterium]MDP5020850.1 ribosome maturation factor RimM [Rickettsiaceae bacterium]MDP5083428.1 ribosome maturation factor RimM [Rickettsiaceae bacterium]
MIKEEKLILVGVISAAHGIQGNVLIKSYTDPVVNIAALTVLDKNRNIVRFKMIREVSKGGVVCKLADCNDRNQAELLKGTKLYCLRETLPKPLDDEFYIEDLRGLKVLNESGENIGTVLEIANYGAGDIIEIKFNDDKCEMFPFTKELFPTIKKDHLILAIENLHIK